MLPATGSSVAAADTTSQPASAHYPAKTRGWCRRGLALGFGVNLCIEALDQRITMQPFDQRDHVEVRRTR